MPELLHNDSLEWPNGLGFTPCTEEYRRVMEERDAICAPGVSIETLSLEDYQQWNVLDDKLANLQLAGHLLPGERI